jgi:hypothetical protein
MIIHYNDEIKSLRFRLGTPLKYSDDYTFIPIRIKNKECIFQTPRMYTPYGIQKNENSKDYLMISFQNMNNDINTKKFYNDLLFLYNLVDENYNDININNFLKEYKGNKCMNLKYNSDALIYDTNKELHDIIPYYSYCSYIIQLAGFWKYNNQLWFQWYVLQTRLENNIRLTRYSFKDNIPPAPPPPPPPPPPMPQTKQTLNKYDKMLLMGVSKDAVNHKRMMESTPVISSELLKSVTLKKNTIKSEKMKTDIPGFEPPNLFDLRKALNNLRNIIIDK